MPDRVQVPNKSTFRMIEVARLLSVNRSTLSRWVSAGRISVVRLGARVTLVSRDEVLRLLR
jgi:excisionase family DNA binding protein